MAEIIQGELLGAGRRFGVVLGRFNELISGRLLEGCLDTLRRHGVDEDGLRVVWVPGAFEIPLVARRLAASGRHDAVICLGAVIRGATAHFEHVGGAAARGIASAAQETGVPCIFGVLTTDSIEQALERAGSKAGNKGAEAALAALEMANLLRRLDGAPADNGGATDGARARPALDRRST